LKGFPPFREAAAVLMDGARRGKAVTINYSGKYQYKIDFFYFIPYIYCGILV